MGKLSKLRRELTARHTCGLIGLQPPKSDPKGRRSKRVIKKHRPVVVAVVAGLRALHGGGA